MQLKIYLLHTTQMQFVMQFMLYSPSDRNKSAIGHFPTIFSIKPIKIHFSQPNFLYILNGDSN